MDEAEDQVILTTFQMGLLLGDLFFSCAKSPPKLVAELLHKAQKCMNTEDTIIAREITSKRKRDERTNHYLEKKKETQSPKQTSDGKRNFLN